MWVHPTVTASIMIAHFDGRHKVRCHMVVVERFGHLLGEALKQVAVPGHRLLEGPHHLGAG